MKLMDNKNRILDCHIHYSLPVTPYELFDIMDHTKTNMANLVIVPDRQRISSVPEALMVKYLNPNKIFVFACLDVTQYFMHKNSVGKHFVKYVKRMLKCGCDGIKMIEGKPDLRRTVPIPDFDLPVWDPFWAFAEAVGLPILWHVNDPEEFWDKSKIPTWAKDRGWFYGEDTINNEDQYRQVLTVLKRHPRLKLIFAHFFFMSAQLERLSKIFDEYPNVCVDLTPGIEMYINFSNNISEVTRFFERFQSRILYGTDIGARIVLSEGFDLNETKSESLNRSNLVRTFLTKSGQYTIQSDGNFLIGVEDFQLPALNLPLEVCQKIFYGNFIRLVSEKPKQVNSEMVIKECKKIKFMIRIMSLLKLIKNPDYSYANQVIDFFKNKKKEY
ncbi:MAG: amidohydrolase family protein [Candidatus Lokiarchaeota archaeon]|nr:amidohydrolase family protein [Candidatus Lokiarchaeota archaeon]